MVYNTGTFRILILESWDTTHPSRFKGRHRVIVFPPPYNYNTKQRVRQVHLVLATINRILYSSKSDNVVIMCMIYTATQA